MWYGLNWIQTCVGKTNKFNFHMWQLKVDDMKKFQCEWYLEIVIQNLGMLSNQSFYETLLHCIQLFRKPNCEKSYEKIQHKKIYNHKILR